MIENYQAGGVKVTEVNFDDVRADLRAVMRDSKEVEIFTLSQQTTHPGHNLCLVLACRLRYLCWSVPEAGLAQCRLLQDLRWSRWS